MPLNKKKVTAIVIGGIAVSLVIAAFSLVPAVSRLMHPQQEPPPDAMPELPLAPLSVARTLLDKCGPDGPWVACLDEVNRVVETYRHRDTRDWESGDFDGGLVLTILPSGPEGPGIDILSLQRRANAPKFGITFTANFSRLQAVDRLMRRWTTPRLSYRQFYQDGLQDAGVTERIDENPISQHMGIYWLIPSDLTDRMMAAEGQRNYLLYVCANGREVDDWRRAPGDHRPRAPKTCYVDFKVIGNHPPKSMSEAWKALTELLLERTFPTKTPPTAQQP